MKTNMKYLYLLVLCLWVWQIRAQVPPTFTNVASGDQALSAQPIGDTANWYHWSNTNSSFSVKVKMTTQGKIYKLGAVKLFLESGGTLYLLGYDNLHGDSTEYIKVSGVTENSNLFFKLENTIQSCPSCTPAIPAVTIYFKNLQSCASYTAPSCELVKDGGFEYSDLICSGLTTGMMPCFWGQPLSGGCGAGTSDYFNSCAPNPYSCGAGLACTVNASVNFGTNGIAPATMTTNTGSGYGGLYVYNIGNAVTYGCTNGNKDYREYLVNPLQSPMMAGVTYNIGMYVRLANRSKYASKDIQVYCSPGMLSQPCNVGNTDVVNISAPTSTASGVLVNMSSSFLSNKTGWTYLSATVTPSVNCSYITIGNFNNFLSSNVQDLDPLNTWTYGTGSSTGQYNGTSYYYIDDVSIKSTGSLLGNQSYSLCGTGTIAIGIPAASLPGGVTSYTWTSSPTDPSLSGQQYSSNPIVSPTVTTLYTLSTSGPCSYPPSHVTVAVVTKPNIVITPNPAFTCVNVPITITASGASTYTWMPGNLTGAAITVTPGTSSIYTVTGKNGCTNTATVPVIAGVNACCQTPSLTLTTGSLSAQTASTTIGNIIVSVTGTLTINVNTTFNGTLMRMGPQAKIIVSPGVTVTMNSTKLFACTYMWEGIELKNATQLICNGSSVDRPTIEDARVAIYVDATSMNTPPVQSHTYTNFGKNYTGIRIDNAPLATAYPMTMSWAIFEGDVSNYYSPGTLFKPYQIGAGYGIYPSTEYGVYLNNVNNITIGNVGSGTTNTMQKMHHGIRSVKSNVGVYRFAFKNLSSSYNNKGIWATGDFATNPPVTGANNVGYGTRYKLRVGNAIADKCSFDNLNYGIFTDSCMLNYIKYNSFTDNATNGIAVYRSYYYRGYSFSPEVITFTDRDSSLIAYNTMSQSTYVNMNNGVGYYDNPYIYAAVLTNTITCRGEGIASYNTSATNFHTYYMQTNKIPGAKYGIHNSNAKAQTVTNNTITVNQAYCPGWLSNPNIGIFSENSPSANVRENVVDETPMGYNNSCIFGIKVNNGVSNFVGCNLLKNCDIGTLFDHTNTSSQYVGNVMNVAGVGIASFNGSLGNLGDASNACKDEWISTGASSYVLNSTGSNIYHDQSIAARTPSVNANGGGGVAFTPFPNTPVNNSWCNMLHKGGTNGVNFDITANQPRNIAIASDQLSFSQYSNGLKWEHRNGLLNALEDSIVDNNQPVLKQFRINQASTNLGKINALMREIGNTGKVLQNKTNFIQRVNSITNSTDVLEQNYKTFLNLYVNYVAGVSTISPSTFSAMQTLAEKCPYSDGAVVYNARALMRIWGDTTYYHNTCENVSYTSSSLQGKSIESADEKAVTGSLTVYPNPNSGDLNIAYSFAQSNTTFELFDLMGKRVCAKSLNGNAGIESMNLGNLDNGVYFYKVTDASGASLLTGKLIINK